MSTPRYISIVTILLVLLALSVSPGAGMTEKQGQHDAIANHSVAASDCYDNISGELNHSERKCLAETYSPIIHFHPEEEYRPTSVQEFIKHSKIREGQAELGSLDNASMDTIAERGENYQLIFEDSDQFDIYSNVDLPRVVYVHVTDTEYGAAPNDEYVAVTYWMFYFHDSKNKEALFDSKLQHQADFESVTVLVNQSGPQFVAGSQHHGGERRPREAVETSGTHPHIYSALGAHSIYFVNTESLESDIVGQKHHEEPTSDSTEQATGNNPIDPTYADYTGNGTTWKLNSDPASLDEQSYNLKITDGTEPWQQYEGSYVKHDLTDILDQRSKAPAHRKRWSNPGQWVASLPSHTEMIQPAIDWELSAPLPSMRGSVNESKVTVNVRIWNNGVAPGRIYVRAKVLDLSGNELTTKNFTVLRKRSEGVTTSFRQSPTTIQLNLSESFGTVRVNVTVYSQPPAISTEPEGKVSSKICPENEWFCGINIFS